MMELCGCCEGLEKLTPLDTANRPGLDALSYRVGTHATFLETMMARLTTLYLTEDGNKVYPLHDLTTRSQDDLAVALLDAWATVADVLTFYQERIANEGYLRTATERRSILELARLVGYKLRPGVAASVFLAFDLEKGYDLLIEPGMRAQSLPGPGELPQPFETGEPLEARAAWNRLGVRMTRPQYIDSSNYHFLDEIFLEGTATNLKPNDLLLFFFHGWDTPVFRRVEAVEPQPKDDRTVVTLQLSGFDTGEELPDVVRLDDLLDPLLVPPSRPPVSSRRLDRSVRETFSEKSDISPQLFLTMTPALRPTLYPAWVSAMVTGSSELRSIEALRVKAAPFGHNAPLKPVYNDKCVPVGYEEWPLAGMRAIGIKLYRDFDVEGGFITALIRFSLEEKGRNFYAEMDPFKPPAEISLGEIKIKPKISGKSYEFTFSNDPNITNIIIRSENETAKMFLDGGQDPDIIISSGQSQMISKGEQRISATFQRLTDFKDAISVSSRVPLGPGDSERKVLALDAQYDKILPGSWVAIERPDVRTEVYSVVSVRTVSRADYGITGTVTQLNLDRDWLKSTDRDLSALRQITVYAQNDPLKTAEEAIDPANHENDICGSLIELDGLYDGLKSGRWLIVSGERVIEGTSGVRSSELVMLSGVAQDVQRIGVPAAEPSYIVDLPDDKTHTFLTLAQGGLAYCYKLDTVSIYGNVARATHGETRSEVLGSGDASKPFQQFPLRQSPLTYLAAATPAGAQSTLKVRVDDVLWHEADSLAGLAPVDRSYVTSTDDDSKTAVVFGNGLQGSRLPTGVENVKAVYRTGIGKPGNVRAGQISLLATRPLGVKGVINPLPATGGADREGRDQARRNAPLAVLALDRLVSVQDYADFARTFAGIGKARAAKLTDGRRQMVFLTIAGADDIPIDKQSDLYQNLVSALHRYGDPHQQIRVELRELLLLVISASVRLHPDYIWDAVEPGIRAAMLDTFSFERRELGQDVLLSEVISVIQNVRGVDYVDVDVLVSIPEKEFESKIKETTANGDGDPKKRRILSPEEILAWVQKRADECGEKYNGPCPRIAVNLADSKDGVFQPDQIAYLTPDVPDTVILREVKP